MVLLVADQKEPEPAEQHLSSSSLPLEGMDANKSFSILEKNKNRTQIKHELELDTFYIQTAGWLVQKIAAMPHCHRKNY